MREIKVASAALALIIGVLAAVSASAWVRNDGTVANVVLPALVNAAGNLTNQRGRVEGLTVGPDNNVYAASNGAGDITNLFVIDPNGNFLNANRICAPPLCSAASPSQTRPRTCLGYASIRPTTQPCGCSTAGTAPRGPRSWALATRSRRPRFS
jgi:hypothetical protein